MASMKLIDALFKQGLGELFILHTAKGRLYFGKMLYEKGRLVIKDNGLLADISPAQLKPCWENGAVGLICNEKGFSWESLTFYGIEQCDFPVDLSQTRHGVLVAAENQYGDHLVDFVGSVYRAYQLMLDNHFLPVVLLNEAKTKDGTSGLVISDLRAAPMDISLIRSIYDEIRKSIDAHLVLKIDDVELDAENFDQLFGDYLK